MIVEIRLDQLGPLRDLDDVPKTIQQLELLEIVDRNGIDKKNLEEVFRRIDRFELLLVEREK